MALNSFELIEKYLPQAVDKYFAEDAKTAVLEQGSKFIDVKFDQTGYVKIASMLMDGLSDYYRAGTQLGDAGYMNYTGDASHRDGFDLGGTTLSWEIFKLQWCRGKQFKIDYIDDEETAGVIIGNAVEEFNRLKVIPEVDASRFGVIADTSSASLGNLITEDIADNAIIGKFNSAFEWLAEHEVPEEEQIIFINPNVMTKIRNSTELAKFLTQGDYRNGAGIDFTVEKYAGRPIIVVPSNRFFTNVLLTNNGYRAQTSSKWINYMVVSAKAVVPVRKLEYNKIYGPEMSGLVGFHGYLINYLLYHGVVIPKNKVVGVYVSVNSTTGATAKTNTLAIDTTFKQDGTTTTTYYWTLRNFFSNPAGLRGKVVYKASALTLGADYDNSGTDIAVGETITETSVVADKSYYFALVDASGKIVAVSGSVKVVDVA